MCLSAFSILGPCTLIGGYSWLQNLLVTKLEFFPTFLKFDEISYMTTLLIFEWCFQYFPREKIYIFDHVKLRLTAAGLFFVKNV